jgi:hypothetical protein
MKKILLSSASAAALAALTSGLATPAMAVPASTAPAQSGDTVMLNAPKNPTEPHNYETDDRYPYHDFGIAKHPYNDSLIPRPAGHSGVTPGQLPSQVPLGPIVGLR